MFKGAVSLAAALLVFPIAVWTVPALAQGSGYSVETYNILLMRSLSQRLASAKAQHRLSASQAGNLQQKLDMVVDEQYHLTDYRKRGKMSPQALQYLANEEWRMSQDLKAINSSMPSDPPRRSAKPSSSPHAVNGAAAKKSNSAATK